MRFRKKNLKKIGSGLILGLVGLSAINTSKTYAKDLNGKAISKEGKYVVEDYKIPTNQYTSWGEVVFTPEKTGVYSLTSTFAKKSENTYMELYSSDFHYSSVRASENTKDKDVMNKKVYLEKGNKYFIQVNTEAKELKTFDFDVKFEGETKVKPEVVATLSGKGKQTKNFSEVKQKGFLWNSETNTLTLDNCKLYGNISISADTSEYDYDTRKFRPVFTIDVKGDSTIKTMDGVCALSYDNNSLDFYREDNLDKEFYHMYDNFDVDVNIKSENKSKLVFDNDKSGMRLGFDSKLTVDNVIVKANEFKIKAGEIYVNDSVIDVKTGWTEIGRKKDGKKLDKWTYEYTPITQSFEVYFTNSKVLVEMELFPTKYAGKDFKNIDVDANLIKFVDKFENSKIVVKAGKNIVNAFKKGNIKLGFRSADTKKLRKNAIYKVVKSYRNGAKKGEVIYNETRTKKAVDLSKDGLAYKVVKRASTDGVKVGKVYVCGITNPKLKIIKLNSVIYNHGCKYKVVGISKKGLNDSSKLKKIVIKSRFIKKIAKSAFVKKSKKLTCVVPKAKKNYYTKLLKKSGFKGKIK